MLSIGGVYFLLSAILSPTPSLDSEVSTLEESPTANLQAVLGMPPGGRGFLLFKASYIYLFILLLLGVKWTLLLINIIFCSVLI